MAYSSALFPRCPCSTLKPLMRNILNIRLVFESSNLKSESESSMSSPGLESRMSRPSPSPPCPCPVRVWSHECPDWVRVLHVKSGSGVTNVQTSESESSMSSPGLESRMSRPSPRPPCQVRVWSHECPDLVRVLHVQSGSGVTNVQTESESSMSSPGLESRMSSSSPPCRARVRVRILAKNTNIGSGPLTLWFYDVDFFNKMLSLYNTWDKRQIPSFLISCVNA